MSKRTRAHHENDTETNDDNGTQDGGMDPVDDTPDITETPPQETADPTKTVSNALRKAAQAMGMGMQNSGEGLTGRLEGIMGQMAYRSAFGLSYAVVFPVATLCRWVPGDNAMVHGMVDGAMAARDAVQGMGSSATEPGSSNEAETMAPAPA